MTVTAYPVRNVRSPASRTVTRPVRAEPWRPVSSVRPSRAAQNGASAVCALPVTGSSGTPTAGKKPRETKSYPRAGSSAAAVTISPRLA